ncbi:MAG: translation initiation factor IF-2 [Chloroflexota bacterium]
MNANTGTRPPRRQGPATNRPRPASQQATPALRPSSAPAKPENRTVEIPPSLTVKDLADLLGVGASQVIKELLRNGVMATINQTIDYDSAAIVATDLGFEPREAAPPPAEELGEEAGALAAQPEKGSAPRPPVVTIMGHVDHGKTSLLDAVRQTNVTATEAGGITQHIGAYQVEIHGQKITFLDTPGHEAFTAMRARGAQATDIAVLVVAADDGVMPQTREAIDHARAAKVPIIVAINKIDKPDANPDRVKQQLADVGLLVEEWGGDTVSVAVSAKRKQGIDQLLEMILLVAELAELKANPTGPVKAVTIEAKLDKARGPVATVLVQQGTLKVGDNVVVGAVSGKVRAMFNDKGKRIRKAEPSTPVEILGLSEVPQAGDILTVAKDEKTARALAESRRVRVAEPVVAAAMSLEDMVEQIRAGEVKQLDLVLKTDVQGSIEPIKNSLERLSDEQVKVKVIHEGTGNVNESDVLLAQASKAIIIGFNVKVEPGARRAADAAKVDIRLYDIIYNVVDDVKKALTGMLEPKYQEVVEGHAEVRQLFRIGKAEVAAGCLVFDGKLSRTSTVRVLRDGQPVFEGRITSLRRFKDDVREVLTNFECGISLDGFKDWQIGDVIESYTKERVS